MRRKGSDLKNLDIFRITEEPEEAANGENNNGVPEKLELLKAEILRLGKSQIQTRTFAKSEYQALHEAIELFAANNDRLADMTIEGLLSIADGLDAGIRAWSAMSDSETASWLDGINIVYQRVMELLEKFDVRPLYPVGEFFDPALHKAVAVEEVQDVSDNIVLEEQRRGYIRGDKVIRYAEVIVNKRAQEHAAQVEENGN